MSPDMYRKKASLVIAAAGLTMTEREDSPPGTAARAPIGERSFAP
jgi:hypothetical protein